MFSLDLVDLNVNVFTEEEAFEIVANRLSGLGMVNDNYLKGITTREKEFPTGLITQHLNIALPHSDPEYVNKPFIFIARLENDVTCKQMGDSQEMSVRDLFFLGIKNGKEQVGLLQAIMNLFMNETFVEQYRLAESPEAVYKLFVGNI
jgi:PTS system galactitol-specific IIA component